MPSVHHRFNKDSVHLRSMYRQLYPQRNSKGFVLSPGTAARLEDSESNDAESRARSQLKKPTLVQSGEGMLAQGSSHNRKQSAGMTLTSARVSPGKSRINIL